MCTGVYFLSVVSRCWTFRQPPWGAVLNTSAMRPAVRMGCLVMTLACPKPLLLYRPRDPRTSDLWRLMDQYFETFRQVYDERYQDK